MNTFARWLTLSYFVFFPLCASGATLENQFCSVEAKPDGTLEVRQRSTGAAATFRPLFAVLSEARAAAPGRGKYEDSGPVGSTNYRVYAWNKQTDYFQAHKGMTVLTAESSHLRDNVLHWVFPAQGGYTLQAEVSLPEDRAYPQLAFHFKAVKAGCYSIGYVGAPEAATDRVEWIWQPLVWQDKRFPNRSYLTPECQCPIPCPMIGLAGAAVGVAADGAEMPFRMATFENSRFGVTVRSRDGQMQPQIFAPVMGGPGSEMKPGETYNFRMHLVVRRGDWYGAYRELAQGLYGFADIRENGICTLNTTIDNMMEYLLTDNYSYWYPTYKTWGYQNDAPGSGRQQTVANALSLALVTDNRDFYFRRSLPTLEYMLSRDSLMTKVSGAQGGDFMHGPVHGNLTDLVAAWRLTARRSPVLRQCALRLAGFHKPAKDPSIAALKEELLRDLALYRLEGDQTHLDEARQAADRYIARRIDRPAENFHDLGSSFWTELSPWWDVLYELYGETGEAKYRQAAQAGLHQFTGYVYLAPAPPAGNFTANRGAAHKAFNVPEETVPAWRVSPTGLTAECAGTSHSHRAIFMAPYAALMARMAREDGDPFLLDIARNAVIGRYANYPSYAYRGGYSTIFEKPDYPLRPFEQIKKITSAHYNHPLPMTGYLIDFLVSDIGYRSKGQIDFPAEYSNTGAYFRNKVYGGRPGRFYADKDVWLWLPKALAASDNLQVNYLAGHGNGKLYLALANASAKPVTATLTLNPQRVTMGAQHPAKVWKDNVPAEDARLVEGKITVAISPKGITALAIDGVAAKTALQRDFLAQAPALPAGSYTEIATASGKAVGMLLSAGKGLTIAYVYLEGPAAKIKRATLDYSIDGQPGQAACAEYPFEFTVPLPADAKDFRFTLQQVSPSGAKDRSTPIALPCQ